VVAVALAMVATALVATADMVAMALVAVVLDMVAAALVATADMVATAALAMAASVGAAWAWAASAAASDSTARLFRAPANASFLQLKKYSVRDRLETACHQLFSHGLKSYHILIIILLSTSPGSRPCCHIKVKFNDGTVIARVSVRSGKWAKIKYYFKISDNISSILSYMLYNTSLLMKSPIKQPDFR
jgi:hypothetical protein